MFNVLTATATVLVVFLAVEFVTGLVKLWKDSAVAPAAPEAPQKPDAWEGEAPTREVAPAAPEAPQKPDAWEGEAPTREVAPAAPKFEFTCQLCLPPAHEVAPAPVTMEVAKFASAVNESLTIRQLKVMAKERGLKKYSYLTKAELITALM